ncbi:hypothetical protein C2S53_005774 [Perilla frutescens var. hirtella]|uniref:Uncharacterized protein n=1 Tax=Perilla frutescens var. hirtella TaxID=608512 RepID=A0AAD4JCZ9_PERFH|nr:hypothetical protein C2S53_005774 [Perilla frutescens var. hirtella]
METTWYLKLLRRFTAAMMQRFSAAMMQRFTAARTWPPRWMRRERCWPMLSFRILQHTSIQVEDQILLPLLLLAYWLIRALPKMPVQQLFENGGSRSYSHPCNFKKPKLNAFRSFPASSGAAPTPLAARSDATHLKLNAVSECALVYSTTPFGSSSSNIKCSKVDLSGKILEHHSLSATGINGRKDEWSDNGKIPRCPDGAQNVVALPAVPLRSVPTINVRWKPEKSVSSHEKDYGQILANTSDNTVHKKDFFKHESDKLEAVIAEAKEFINLLDSKYSTPKTFPIVDAFLKDSRESNDQLPSLKSDAFHPCTSIGVQKPMMETVKHHERERNQISTESFMLQNLDKSRLGKGIKDNSGISLVVEEKKASGTETLSVEDEDEFSLLSSEQWNALQFHFNHKDECTKPSMVKLEKKLERRSSLKFARECRNAIEPQGISAGTKSDQPNERFYDFELTETKCREHQVDGSMDLDEISTIAKSEQDKPLKTFSPDDETVAINSINEPEYCENHKESINLEIVQRDHPQGRKVMQALKLFKEEYVKLLNNHELEWSGEKTVRFPHIEAGVRVKAKGMGVSKDNKRFGHIPGIEIGDEFSFRSELDIVGLHCQLVAGIDSVKIDGNRYATSVVNSGCYENTATTHGTLIYSGQGGNPKVSNSAAADQKLEKGNLAMTNSMKMGYPVRVISRRSCPMTSKSLSRKNERGYMYVYDGLYTIKKYWQEREDQTKKLVYKFELQRLPGQPRNCGTNVKLGKQIKANRGVCVLDDVSRGKEKFPVRVMNAVDDDLPLPFTYITKIVYPPWYQRSDPIGCNCIDGCSDSEQCPCVIKNGGEIPFNEKGAILRAMPNKVVHECGPSCKCPPSCMNRVSQHGPRYRFEIFKTKSMGWGVRSRDYILRGSFICEYVGELLGDQEADQRIGNDEYLFDISQSRDLKDDGFALDAGKYGNVARFINHSCSPNVFSQEIIYDNNDKRMPRIMFFAGKNIPPKQELRYDYNYKENRVRDENGNIKEKACHCGSQKCTARLDKYLSCSNSVRARLVKYSKIY